MSSVTEFGKVATRPSAAIDPRSPDDKTAPDVGDESLARRRTLPETTATVVVSPAVAEAGHGDRRTEPVAAQRQRAPVVQLEGEGDGREPSRALVELEREVGSVHVHVNRRCLGTVANEPLGRS